MKQHNTDIICLQEVEAKEFTYFFQPELLKVIFFFSFSFLDI